MPENEGGSQNDELDEHGCKKGKEEWNGEKCVPITADAKPAKNPIAKMTTDEAYARIAFLEKELAKREETIVDLTAELKEANDVLEAQTKADLIRDILPRTVLTAEELTARSLEELKNIRMTLDQAKLPTFKTVRFGPIGADEKEDERLTVGDLSIVTAKKREAGRA